LSEGTSNGHIDLVHGSNHYRLVVGLVEQALEKLPEHPKNKKLKELSIIKEEPKEKLKVGRPQKKVSESIQIALNKKTEQMTTLQGRIEALRLDDDRDVFNTIKEILDRINKSNTRLSFYNNQ